MLKLDLKFLGFKAIASAFGSENLANVAPPELETEAFLSPDPPNPPNPDKPPPLPKIKTFPPPELDPDPPDPPDPLDPDGPNLNYPNNYPEPLEPSSLETSTFSLDVKTSFWANTPETSKTKRSNLV